MIFDNVKTKLKYLENVIIEDKQKYINKYDALSLSMINFDNNTNSNYALDMPKMDGLRRLVQELNDILTEGFIAQQVKIIEIKSEIGEANTLWNNIMKTIVPNNIFDIINNDSNNLTDANKQIDFNELNEITDNITNNTELNNQLKALEKQIKPILSNLYNKVTEIIDNKLDMLQTTKEITTIYMNSIVNIAITHGVLEVNRKSNMVITPLIDPLIKHKLFLTNEEQQLLQLICEMWSTIVYHCKDHILFANRQLSFEYHHSNITNNEQIFYYTRIGGTIILLFWAISECFNNESSEREIWNDQTFSIFMCFGDLLLLLVMWGVSIHVWRSVGIDYIQLLELENTEIMNEKSPEVIVYSSSSNLSILFLISFILFNKAVRGGYFAHSNLTLAHAIPALLVVFCTLRIFLPFQTRKQWLFMLWRVLLAPCYQINFRDSYIGDLLTSLVRVLIPLSFSFIYVFVTLYAWLSNHIELTVTESDNWWTSSIFHNKYLVPFLTLLPLWLRLMQCLRRSVESGKRWPHMANALKYTSAIIVISYGTFQPNVRHNPIWIASFVFATLFQFTWDLTQDWGLIIFIPPRTATIISNSSGIEIIDYIVGSSLSFRKTRLLGSLKIYYLVIIFNLILRFSWTLTLLPTPIDDNDTHTLYVSLITHISPLLASLEIIRRMVWGFFRLEHEQLEKLNKSENLLLEINKDSYNKFDKMEISNSIEMQPIEINSYTRGESTNSYDVLYNDYDWSIYLPSYVQSSINHMTHPFRLSSYASKLRFVESILFALIVIYIIYTAAIP